MEEWELLIPAENLPYTDTEEILSIYFFPTHGVLSPHHSPALSCRLRYTPSFFLLVYMTGEQITGQGSSVREEYGLLCIKQMLNDYKHHIGREKKQAAVSCACHITAPAWQISSNPQLVFIR